MPGTVKTRESLNPEKVAERLRNAMAGIGTNDDVIVRVLGNHTSAQRIEIAQAYKKAYGKELVEEIKGEVHGDFEDVCVALLTPYRNLDAVALYNAMHRPGTDETTLVDILCTKTNQEINELKDVYKGLYGNDLEADLRSDTTGYFRRLMVSLVTAGRDPEPEEADLKQATEDAKKFFIAGEARWGTDEGDMNEILVKRSRKQLLKVFDEFERVYGKTIEKSIDDECRGSLQKGFLAIVESTRDLPGYFARRIRESTKCVFTKDSDLIRIIVGRSEIDMEEVASAFASRYGARLVDILDKECSGHYKKLMISLVSDPPKRPEQK